MDPELARFVPYTLDQMQLERRPCECSNPECPAGSFQARYYFFSRFNVGNIQKLLWWHGRN